jgi:hypothetical protein
MIDIVLLPFVVGMVLLALAVDVAALVAWLRRRWRCYILCVSICNLLKLQPPLW